MKNKIFIFLILLILLLLNAARTSADNLFLADYNQVLYNSESGMEANEANDVCQTSDGYIWIATYSGLMRFDGAKFQRFNTKADNFTAKSATTLFEDSRKRLWVGTNDKGLFVRENGRFRHIEDASGGGFNTIRALAEDAAGRIYFGAGSGIGVVSDKGLVRVGMGEWNSSFLLDMSAAPDGSVWAVARTGELFVLRDGKLKRRFTQKELGGHGVISILQHSSGTMYGGLSDGGLLQITYTGGELTTRLIKTPGMSSVNGLFEDRSGRLWLCADNGPAYFDADFKFHKVDGCRLNSSLERILQDYEGQYWLASSRQGMLQLSRNKFTDINFALGVPAGVVNAALAEEGRLYIGSDEGLCIADKNYRFIETPYTKALAGKRVRHLMRDSKGNLWISVYSTGDGLMRVKPDGSVRIFSKADGMPNNKIRMTMERANGDVVAATNGGGAVIRGDKVVQTIGAREGLTNLTILTLCENGEGALCIGTDGGGIFMMKDGSFKNYTADDGLNAGVILRLFYDKQYNGLWVSAGNGLCFMNAKGTIRQIAVDAPITSGIFDIVENSNGKLVLLADTGVHIADKKALFAGDDVKWESYMHRDGLHSTVTANSWNLYDGSGKLYLCGTNGLYSINLDHVQKNKHRPKLAVNRVTADGKVFENTTKIEIPSTTKRLTVDLAVLSYMNPDYNRGQYRLKGFDKEDNYGGPKELSNISYTNLKGGTYTLEFTAENSDGVTSTAPLEIIIVKERAFHEQPAVVVMAVLLLAALIFLLTRWYYQRRAKGLERRQEELRAIVAQAFSAIADTIDAKDTYTRGHSTRVAEYSRAVAKEMGFSQQQLDNLYYTALLHDIGKIGIPDNILNKPAKLTDEEYEIMKQHPAKGGHILRNITIIDEIKDGAAYHHEKYDGTGYNEGLKREGIPLIARIICVADALDAMASTRPYRTARSLDYILSELEKNTGTQFDPQIARIMIELLKNGKLKLYQDGEEER